MVTDRTASMAWVMLEEGSSVASVARRLKMGQRTVRKYRDAKVLPSQRERLPRDYRTRRDPLAEFWGEVELLLKHDSQLKPITILDWLKQKHNRSGSEPIVTDSIRRTLERRVARWKLAHEVEQDVKFPQVHQPGDVVAFDFVVMNALRVTIAGRPFDHMLFHAVLTYSNWEYVHLCHAESYEALSTGLQDALYRAGGVPRRIRSDSLSAAVNNLSSDKEFATQYKSLLGHYGVQGHRINVRKPHENGDVESAHGHLKTAVDQALRLRGSRDFGNVQEFVAFIEQLVDSRNAARSTLFHEERAALSPLPPQRLSPLTIIPVTVSGDCILRIKRNAYSVSSKYIGLRMDVQIHQDHLELWYRGECLERMPRLFGHGKEAVDFRHVIDSLVRKPGAFLNYKYVNHMYPTTRFRMAYDHLVKNLGETSAVKQYLKILHAAKYEGLDLVDNVLRWFLTEGKPITASDVKAQLKSQQEIPGPTDVNVEPPCLDMFDSLLQHKDVYDEEEAHDIFPPNAFGEKGDVGLEAYDRHVETFGPVEGTEAADVSGSSQRDGRAGSPRAMDSHPVPGGDGSAGMPIATPEPHRTTTETLTTTDGEDLGAVRVVSSAPACDTAVRDAAQWQLPRSTGQPVDFRQTRFGEDESALCVGRPIGTARPLGLLLDLPDVGPGIVACETGLSLGTSHQEAAPLRGVDHRRPGLRSAEPRRDGGPVHPLGGTIRTRQRPAQLEPGVFELGADLQRSDDDRGCHRPTDSPLGDHRTEHPQLSAGGSQTQQAEEPPTTSAPTWFTNLGRRVFARLF